MSVHEIIFFDSLRYKMYIDIQYSNVFMQNSILLTRETYWTTMIFYSIRMKWKNLRVATKMGYEFLGMHYMSNGNGKFVVWYNKNLYNSGCRDVWSNRMIFSWWSWLVHNYVGRRGWLSQQFSIYKILFVTT